VETKNNGALQACNGHIIAVRYVIRHDDELAQILEICSLAGNAIVNVDPLPPLDKQVTEFSIVVSFTELKVLQIQRFYVCYCE
jgi:hypothetical protein